MCLGFMFNGMFLGVSLLICILGIMILLGVLAFRDTKSIARVLGQMTSARWILAVMAGVAFVFFCGSVVITIISQRMEFKPETIIAMLGSLLLVIQGVYKDYFNAKSTESFGNGNGSDGLPTPELKKPEIKPPEVK